MERALTGGQVKGRVDKRAGGRERGGRAAGGVGSGQLGRFRFYVHF